jgi:hypothetical protein
VRQIEKNLLPPMRPRLRPQQVLGPPTQVSGLLEISRISRARRVTGT